MRKVEWALTVLLVTIVSLALAQFAVFYETATGLPLGSDYHSYSEPTAMENYAPFTPLLLKIASIFFPSTSSLDMLPIVVLAATALLLSYLTRSAWATPLYLFGNMTNAGMAYVIGWNLAQAIATILLILLVFRLEDRKAGLLIPATFFIHKFIGVLVLVVWLATKTTFKTRLLSLIGYSKTLLTLPSYTVSAYRALIYSSPLIFAAMSGFGRLDEKKSIAIAAVLVMGAFAAQTHPGRSLATMGTVLVIPATVAIEAASEKVKIIFVAALFFSFILSMEWLFLNVFYAVISR